MAETNPDVMEMVEEALRENPDIDNSELQEKAAEIDPEVGELSARSFNARYPLQVKRQQSQEREAEEETSTGTATADDDVRERLREELIDFAKAVAGAEDRGKVIEMVEGVDERVDRVLGET